MVLGRAERRPALDLLCLDGLEMVVRRYRANRDVVLKALSSDLWESPRIFQKVHKRNTVFIRILRCYLPFPLGCHWLGWCQQNYECKYWYVFTWVKTGHQRTHHCRKKMGLGNDLDKVVTIITFIKSWPLTMCLFNVLCDTIGSTHRTPSLPKRTTMTLSRKICGV